MFVNDEFCQLREENKVTKICSAKIISPRPMPLSSDHHDKHWVCHMYDPIVGILSTNKTH